MSRSHKRTNRGGSYYSFDDFVVYSPLRYGNGLDQHYDNMGFRLCYR